ELADYGMVLFTSANAVERFVARLRHRRVDPQRLGTTRVMAIGPATAAAVTRHAGVAPEVVQDDHRAEGVIDHLTQGAIPIGWRVLLPRAEEAREILPGALRSRGARVDVVTVYRTVAQPLPDEVLEMLRAGAIDLVTFASASAARAGVAALPDLDVWRSIDIAVI